MKRCTSESVQSVCEDANHTMWIGTVSGQLARRVGENFQEVSLTAYTATKLGSLTVFPDLDGSLWIGAQRGGIMHLQLDDALKTPRVVSEGTFPIRMTFVDRSGRLWLGAGAGLYLRENGDLRHVGERDGFRRGFGIGAIAEDPSGLIWIASGPGELWEYSKGRFVEHKSPVEWPQARYSAMLADSNGVVWIGTLGGGLARFENENFTRITSAQGPLPLN